jgi:hypothetical protein
VGGLLPLEVWPKANEGEAARIKKVKSAGERMGGSI